ncbi:Uncharacterised protein [Vibrio cholerae]|nr:Uncharacterised protein [Vibrio cholerae]
MSVIVFSFKFWAIAVRQTKAVILIHFVNCTQVKTYCPTIRFIDVE